VNKASKPGAAKSDKPKKKRKHSKDGSSIVAKDSKPEKPAAAPEPSKAEPDKAGGTGDKAAVGQTAAAPPAATADKATPGDKTGKTAKPAAAASTGKAADEERAQGDGDKAKDAKPTRVVKPKVVYDMPGQTRPKPDEEEPLAIFYTSMLKQKPESELANKWCVLARPAGCTAVRRLGTLT
jgi:hypothetical protein